MNHSVPLLFAMLSHVPNHAAYYQPQIDAWTFWLGVVRPFEAGVGIMPRLTGTPRNEPGRLECCFPAKKMLCGDIYENPPTAIWAYIRHVIPVFSWSVSCNQFRKTLGAAWCGPLLQAAAPHLLGGERQAHARPIITCSSESQVGGVFSIQRDTTDDFQGQNSLW